MEPLVWPGKRPISAAEAVHLLGAPPSEYQGILTWEDAIERTESGWIQAKVGSDLRNCSAHGGASTGWPQGHYGGVPAGHHLPENPQNGQTRLPAGMVSDGAGMTKRQRIEEYLDWLGPEELQNLTVRELTTELAGQGLEVTERYVKQILDQHRPPPQPQRRRRGSGNRRPRR